MVQLSFKEADSILNDLEKGQTLTHILVAHAQHMRYLIVLSEKLSLSECFECINALNANKKMFSKMILKQGMYPFLIFFFSYVILVFFINQVMPQMLIFLKQDSFHFILMGLKTIYSLIFIVSFSFVFLLFYMIFDMRIVWLDQLLKPFMLFQWMDSYQFALIYASFMKQGLSSKECLQLMEQMQPLRVCFYAQNLLTFLEHGIPFEDGIGSLHLDSSLLFFMKVGMKTQCVETMMNLYCQNCFKKMELTFKKISMYQQCISYSCVGLLVVVVYQVLLLPLNMLYEI